VLYKQQQNQRPLIDRLLELRTSLHHDDKLDQALATVVNAPSPALPVTLDGALEGRLSLQERRTKVTQSLFLKSNINSSKYVDLCADFFDNCR
jgi:hypothetical protein